MSQKFKIILVLTCLAIFSVAAVVIAFDDVPQDYLKRSTYKIKSPVSSFVKTKPVKFTPFAFDRPHALEPGRFSMVLCIHTKGGLDSFQFCSLSNRAPPFLS